MIKLIILLMSTTISLSAFSEDYDDLFLGTNSQTRFVIPYLNFVEGADIGSFREIYSKTFKQLRDERVENAKDLLAKGAIGSEVVAILQYIEDSVKRRRAEVKVNLDKTLFNFKSHSNFLYEKYQPSGKRMEFRHNSLSLNPSELKGDYLIYGTYHFDRGDLWVDLHMVNTHSLVERSFSAFGHPRMVGKKLAAKVFHHFYKTRFPSKLRVGNKLISMVDRGYVYSPGGANANELHRSAKQNCSFQSANLVSKSDFDLLKLRGIYRGGVSLGKYSTRRNYYWAISFGDIFLPNFYASATNVSRPTYLEYICVKK